MSSPHTDTIYFFGQDNAHGAFSQFCALKFAAPLPTHTSITTVAPSTERHHTFRFAEQYMMYAKAMAFSDSATAAQILVASTPRKCKGLGRQVEGFSDEVWDRYKEGVVEEGNWWKFTNGEGKPGRRAREALLDTGDKELVEASPFDRVWGIGFREEDADRNTSRWGSNLLGKAIMRVRNRVREEMKKEGQGHQGGGCEEPEH